jgi:multidrug efflux pump subunit AcrA (membrane-fusion protein)
VQVGDPVEVSPSARPEETFRGVVAFVSVGLDPKTRSADVRVVVDNESGLLRAGQAVRANIRPVAARRRTVVVPRAAVAQIDGAPTLFVARDARTFEPRQVTLGIGDQERVEIAAGLRPEERLAVSGVFALKGELFR